MTEPTLEQKWIEVLEWEGWKQIHDISPLDNKTPIVHWKFKGKLYGTHPPMSLDAVHEVEKKLSDYCGEHGQETSQRDQYALLLLRLVGTWQKDGFDWGDSCHADFFKVANAEVPQRIDALWRTVKG